MSAHRIKDISGFRFGSLIVLSHIGRSSGNQLYKCVCDCGAERTFYYCNLVTGKSKSCGCMKGPKISAHFTRHGESYVANNTPEYKTWSSMKARCLNRSRLDFKYYGARGIKVCDRWLNSYETFLSDMGRRPSGLHSIDRFPNNDGNYEPGNCRWATRKEQNNNTRRNKPKAVSALCPQAD